MASVLESDVSHSSATATMERPHRAEDRREALAAARGWRGAEKDVEDAGEGLSAGALLVEGLAEQAGGAILRFGPPIVYSGRRLLRTARRRRTDPLPLSPPPA